MTIAGFTSLHQSGNPLVLYNAWDAGSAVAIAEAGARAIATGSHSLAGARGYDDGECIPFAQLLEATGQIAKAVALPLTIDIEAGYATSLADLARNASALAQAGAIGCNLEDRLIRAGGLRPIEEQSERIGTIAGEGLFVNARTDVFLAPLQAGKDPNQIELVEAAIERASAYRAAGAACFFIPGLSDPDMIAQLCNAVPLPINVMRLPGMVSNSELAKLGVARISYGGAPWHIAMAGVTAAARAAFAD